MFPSVIIFESDKPKITEHTGNNTVGKHLTAAIKKKTNHDQNQKRTQLLHPV